ncbi:MAG TPA: hypothetical protein VF628_08345 [Allosphingosinicella sp.]
MTVSIDIRCDNCSGDNISIPLWGGDDSELDCEDCGARLGTLDDLKTLLSLQVIGRKTVERPAFMQLQ